jgi:hypothetical protein
MSDSTQAQPKGRRKFIYWVTGAVSAVMFWKLQPLAEKVEKKETMKMLTEDGQLVEVDMDHMTGQKQKLKAEEFHSWVKKKG